MFYEFKHFGSGRYFLKEYGENFCFPPHMHLCFEFITILEGQMRVMVDGKEVIVSKGEGLFLFPNQLHSLSSKKSRHMLCIFSPDLVRAFAAKTENKLPTENRFIPDPYLTQYLERMDTEADVIAKKGFLYSLCANFDANAQYYSRQSGKNGLLSSIFSFVEEHFAEDCTLESLSAKLGYDYAYLSRYFKQSTTISFTEYLNRYRLNKACYLLDNTDQSVLQCALDVGYNSLRTFNRNFKKEFSMTPAKYRKERS